MTNCVNFFRKHHCKTSCTGTHLGGGNCTMPPLGASVMHKHLRIVRKMESCPPPLFGIWEENLSRKTSLFWVKIFFFWSSPNSAQKNELNLSEYLFLDFIILKFPGPPFESPAHATAHVKRLRYICYDEIVLFVFHEHHCKNSHKKIQTDSTA